MIDASKRYNHQLGLNFIVRVLMKGGTIMKNHHINFMGSHPPTIGYTYKYIHSLVAGIGVCLQLPLMMNME